MRAATPPGRCAKACNIASRHETYTVHKRYLLRLAPATRPPRASTSRDTCALRAASAHAQRRKLL